MVLLLICGWDDSGLRLNTAYCGSKAIHWGCCGVAGLLHWIGVSVMEAG